MEFRLNGIAATEARLFNVAGNKHLAICEPEFNNPSWTNVQDTAPARRKQRLFRIRRTIRGSRTHWQLLGG